MDHSSSPALLKRAEQFAAVILTLIVLLLLLVRAKHAGPLWRDECNLLQLARMNFADFRENFRFDSTPLFGPAVLRIFTDLFGTSDPALRAFGFITGAAVIGAGWWNAATLGKGVPLFFLSLAGCNAAFLFWGTSVRGYGMGSFAIVVAFVVAGRTLLRPTPSALVVLAVVWLAAAHLLYFNCALVAAIAIATIAVFLIRREFRYATIVAGIAFGCACTYVPYFVMSEGLDLRTVVGERSSPGAIWHELMVAAGNGTSILPILWGTLFFAAIAAALTWLIYRRRRVEPPAFDLLCFAVITAIIALFTYYNFMRRMPYSPRTWYFIALLCCAGAIIDLVANTACRSVVLRLVRLAVPIVIVLVSVPGAWPKLLQRQSNVGAIANAFVRQAGLDDLIVVERWTLGVTFNWYYHGPTRWMTLPPLNDHRSHRYDLLKAKLSDPSPLHDLNDAMTTTLRSGHRVWIVTEGDENKYWPVPLPTTPAPDPRIGWNQWGYRRAWFEQLMAFIQRHAERSGIAIPREPNDGAYENVGVSMAEGWRE